MLCPICKKLFSKDYRPFCSKRCQQLDLHHWITEDYSIPVEEFDDIAEEEIEKLVDLKATNTEEVRLFKKENKN